MNKYYFSIHLLYVKYVDYISFFFVFLFLSITSFPCIYCPMHRCLQTTCTAPAITMKLLDLLDVAAKIFYSQLLTKNTSI